MIFLLLLLLLFLLLLLLYAKTISDVVEALLGAYYLYCSNSLTETWKNIIIKFGMVPYSDVDTLSKIHELNGCKTIIASSLLSPEKALLVKEVQGVINYQFLNISLLLEAFTHASYQDTDLLCYQVENNIYFLYLLFFLFYFLISITFHLKKNNRG